MNTLRFGLNAIQIENKVETNYVMESNEKELNKMI